MRHDEIAPSLTWDLTALYADIDGWRAEKERLSGLVSRLPDHKGHLGDSAQTLLAFLDADTAVDKLLSSLYLYASLRSDEDLGDASNRALVKEIEQVETDYSQATSYAEPELSALSDERVSRWLAEAPRLAEYGMLFDRLRRRRPHILSDREERLLSLTSLLGDTPRDAFDIFSDAEMPRPTVTLHDGTAVTLDHSTYARVRASSNRDDRRTAFEAFWDNYRRYEGTFGELLNGKVRQRLFSARARGYDTALDAALIHNAIPREVYTGLIANVREALPTFHRYLRVKARLLGVEQLHYYDLYAPPAASLDKRYTWAEAQATIDEALRPLGEEYRGVVRRAFSERWIDAMPAEGKASGAYSNGAAYDVHPYILMNFDGRYSSVSTLAHELGHALHSYMTNRSQPYPTHSYSTFVAEVASTFNEALLDHHVLRGLTGTGERLALLSSMLDGFKGTLFRQTQFAEFQLRVHTMAEQGEPITGGVLSRLYLQLTREYYGHSSGACVVDEPAALEWAFIPHFYMGFYVWQYSTSFVASQALASSVLRGEAGSLERYMGLLRSGDSRYPIDLLRSAGVDMQSGAPFARAVERLDALLDEVEGLLA